MSTAVYIGAGSDTRPICALAPLRPLCSLSEAPELDVESRIRHFVYVDSRPRTEFPTVENPESMLSPTFVDDVVSEMAAVGMHHEPFTPIAAPFRARFQRKDGVTLHYYMSLPFSNALDESNSIVSSFIEEMSSANTLIVAGFFPHYSILDRIRKPVRLATFENTYYADDEDYNDPENVVRYLHRNPLLVGSILHFYKRFVGVACSTLGEVAAHCAASLL